MSKVTRFAILALMLATAAAPIVRAVPGPTFVVLAPGPSAGGFDADAYVQDPGRWPAADRLAR